MVTAVKGLAHHRFDIRYGAEEQRKHISSVADGWDESDTMTNRPKAVCLLQEYAKNGIAGQSLLRAFFAPAMDEFNVSGGIAPCGVT